MNPKKIKLIMITAIIFWLSTYQNHHSTYALTTIDDINLDIIQQNKAIEFNQLKSKNNYTKKTPKKQNKNKIKQSIENNIFLIKNINIKGSTLLKKYEIHYIKKPYINKQLSNTDIYNLIQDIQNYYAKKGWITTRASIPKQNINNGTLTIHVTEGSLQSLKTEANTWIDRLNLWQLFPVNENTPFNNFGIKLGLNNAERLRSIQATNQLYPGDSIGQTKSVISIKPIKTPWFFYINYSANSDNSLIPSYLQVKRDNLLGIYDLWALSYSNSSSTTLTASMPFKATIMSIDYINSQTNEYRQGYYSTNIVDISAEKMTYTTQWTCFYTDLSTVTITPSFSTKRTQTHENTSSISDIKLRLGTVSIDARYLHFGQTNLNLTYETTVPYFNATRDESGIDADSEHYEFEKWTGSAQQSLSYTLPWIGQLASSATLTGQYITKVTQTSEFSTLGGWYSVRGFNDSIQYGENSMQLRTETTLPISQYKPPVFNKANIQIKGFLDGGLVKRRHDLLVSSDHNNSLGYALGIGGGIGFNLFNGQFNWSIARGLYSNNPIRGLDTFWTWSVSF